MKLPGIAFTLPGSVFRNLIQPLYVWSDPRVDARNDLTDRYRVVLTLAREDTPPYFLNEETRTYEFRTADFLEGDSYIRVVDEGKSVSDKTNSGKVAFLAEAHVAAQKRELRIEGTSNKRGRLAKLSIEIVADRFYDAEAAAFDAASPFLSWLSFFMDHPVRVSQIDVEQVSTTNAWWTAIAPFSDHIFFTGRDPVSAKPSFTPYLRGLVALYREGINSNSRNYQFLCWYKIVEAINWKRSCESGPSAPLKLPEALPKTREGLLETLKLVFPSFDDREPDPMCVNIFPSEHWGWKFNRIRQEKLEPIRNKIAHMLTEPTGGLGLLPDDSRHLGTVSEWLPVLRLIARVMLLNEFDVKVVPD